LSGIVVAPRLPFKPPSTLSLQVFLVERDIQDPLQDLGHVLERVLDPKNFRQTLELLLELSVGREAEVEKVRPCRLEDTR